MHGRGVEGDRVQLGRGHAMVHSIVQCSNTAGRAQLLLGGSLVSGEVFLCLKGSRK